MVGADRTHLDKPMHGQTDAPRAWFLEAKDRLISCGLKQHPMDPCVFTVRDGAELIGLVSIHEDDMLVTGSDKFQRVLADIRSRSQFRTFGDVNQTGTLEYCGATISRSA